MRAAISASQVARTTQQLIYAASTKASLEAKQLSDSVVALEVVTDGLDVDAISSALNNLDNRVSNLETV